MGVRSVGNVEAFLTPSGFSPGRGVERDSRRMRLLEWLDEHPTGSLTAAAQKLGLNVAEVEALCDELVAAGMIERVREQ